MGYNQNCIYQDCIGQCCNQYGDCPEWYSNGKVEYTNCYYYYGVNPNTIYGAIAAVSISILIIIIIICVCYRMDRRRKE